MREKKIKPHGGKDRQRTGIFPLRSLAMYGIEDREGKHERAGWGKEIVE